jgi:hypothetical protein
MEAQTQSMNDAAQGSAPQPQRDRRQNRSRNKTAGYYKTDPVPTEETKPLQQQGSNDSNQDAQDKSQRQHQGGQRQGNIRGERTSFQPKAQTTQNGESNGSPTQSPKENGRPKNRRQKQNNPREDTGTKKNYQKKNQDAPEKQESYNERFDNSEVIEKSQPAVRNPHMAHQIAEAARIQQLLPSELSKEVQEKIKKVRDVVALDCTNDHEIYAVLEENHFDEEKAISSLLEPNGKAVHDNGVARPKWTNVVTKGIKHDYPVIEPQRNRSQQPRSGSPKFPVNSQTQNVHPVDNRSPVMEAFVSSGMMDPEMVVQSLTLAIQSQLQLIQEQTKMLTMMQNELTVITQSGTSEREQLLQEEEDLRHRKAQLEEELRKVHIRMEQVEQALEENKKKKADKINSITQNNMVAALLKKSPALAQLPGPTTVNQSQVQQRPVAPRQQGQRRSYNQ